MKSILTKLALFHNLMVIHSTQVNLCFLTKFRPNYLIALHILVSPKPELPHLPKHKG